MSRVPYRENWEGPPVRISSGWRLTKSQHIAECELFAHPLGWELQLSIDRELHRSQVCRSQDDVLDVQEYWRTLMRDKGWG
jgi:hypothetical protein